MYNTYVASEDEYVLILQRGGETYSVPPPPVHRFESRFIDYVYSTVALLQWFLRLKLNTTE